MSGLDDDEAREALDDIGFEPPDEKTEIEIHGQCRECGCQLFRLIKSTDELECDDCGRRFDR